MQVLFILLFTVFFIGCGTPIRFSSDEGPGWAAELSSRVDEGVEKEKGKVRSPKAKARARFKKKLQPRTVHDIVTPKKIVPPPVVEKPPWVADLAKRVEVKKVGKQSRRPAKQIAQDLVAVLPEAKQQEAVVVDKKSPAKVDFVFIVDSSDSMFYFLRQVKKTFAGFIQALAPLDWKIMFTQADHGGHGFFLPDWASLKGRAFQLERDGEILHGKKYMTKNTEGYQRVFLDTLRLHESFDQYHHNDDWGNNDPTEKHPCDLPPGCQGWNEQPLKALKASFTQNRSFFRPDAKNVVAIVFSDSDEGELTKSKKRVKAQDVVKAFQAEWGKEGKKLKTYGIIMIPGKDEKCVKEHVERYLGWGGEGLFGVELAKMAELTGGINSSLCEDSYVPLAKQIVSDFN